MAAGVQLTRMVTLCPTYGTAGLWKPSQTSEEVIQVTLALADAVVPLMV
jgi:hypothetical protein